MTHKPKAIPLKRNFSGVRNAIETAADLCRESIFVESDSRNAMVFDLFEDNPSLLNVAVVDEGEVVGLINRDSFMRSMARRFHWELYANKRCSKMMDEAPIAVDADMPIRELANQLLNSSHDYRLSDGFVITRDKKLIGTGLTSEVLAAILILERVQAEELARANELLRELTITDALTGLHNRRHFNDVLEVELTRAHRERQSVGLIMLDIDYFKKLNDKLGHQAGDEALQKVAKALQGSLRRPSDYCFRIGGEEFAVLTMNASDKSITAIGEILRIGIADLRIANPEHPQGIVTVSAGLALSSPGCESASQLYERADQALYKAKKGGRNRIVLSEIGVPLP